MSDSPKACRKVARTAGLRGAARPSTTGDVDEQAQASMQYVLDPDAAGVSAYRHGMKRGPEDTLDMSFIRSAYQAVPLVRHFVDWSESFPIRQGF